MLAAFFAAVALLLAGIGLYAVLNYSVLQRRREIGIRIAIGSTRAGIVRIVTFDVFLMTALGGCAGVALGFAAARYVESLFYQVKATDADMIALPACAILLTALVATLRRGSRAAHRPHRDPARGVKDRVPLIANLQMAIGFTMHLDH
jgi:ABC-type antimicrobial peptide transport system permease subunit